MTIETDQTVTEVSITCDQCDSDGKVLDSQGNKVACGSCGGNKSWIQYVRS